VPVVSTLGHSPSTPVLGGGVGGRSALGLPNGSGTYCTARRHGSRQGQRLMMRGLEEGQTGAGRGPDKYQAKRYVWSTPYSSQRRSDRGGPAEQPVI
jgi:hypothetical protein